MAKKETTFLTGKWHLVVLILFFLIVRLWFLQTRIIPRHTDELYIGTVANEIATTGLKIPLSYCLIMPHAGGTVVTEYLTAFFFYCFNNSYLTLKLVAFSFSFVSFIFFMFLLEKYFDPMTTIVGGLFFIFPPALFSRASLMLLGNHCESLFFSAVTIYIYYSIFYTNEEIYSDKKLVLYALLGAICGFSLYFDYIFISVLLTFFIVWFAVDRRFFSTKYFCYFFISFVIGFTPAIYYNLVNNFSGTSFLRGGYSGEQGALHGLSEKIGKYLFNNIPALFDYRYNVDAFGIFLIRKICLVLLVVSFLFVCSRILFEGHFKRESSNVNKRSLFLNKRTFFIIYIIVFSCIYFFSPAFTNAISYASEKNYLSYYLSLRYFLPLYPAIFFILTFFIKDMLVANEKYKKITGGLLTVFFCASGFTAMYLTPEIKSSKDNLIYRNGYSYSMFAGEMFTRARIGRDRFDLKKLFDIGDNINKEFYNEFFYGAGFSTRHYFIDKKLDVINEINNLVSSRDFIEKSYFYEGLGYGIGLFNGFEPVDDIIETISDGNKRFFSIGFVDGLSDKGAVKDIVSEDMIGKLNVELHQVFLPVIGFNIMSNQGSLEKVVNKIEAMNTGNKNIILRGVGLGLFYENRDNPSIIKNVLDKVPPGYSAAILEGSGIAIASSFDGTKYNNIISSFSDDEKKHIYSGIARIVVEKCYYNCNKISDFINKIDPEYHASFYQGFGSQAAFRFSGNEMVLNAFMDKIDLKNKMSFKSGFMEEKNELTHTL
ncbi:MAG: glycosyltransferase family 39 protein [Candidatus Schekmanbacteria bacterium]|nr:glycosyltransferase family 39 protein [Candidatus Schekmanbacteria bacterium]